VYSLQRTLNAQPSLGELIKVLRITALIHVSEESWDPSPLLTSIRDIIGLCPNLARLDVDRDISNREHTIFGQIFAPPFSQLKTLNTLNTPFFFLDYAAHFRALSSLSVILLDSPRRETLPDPPRIDLPTLRELRMLFPARSGVPKSLDLITDYWTLPALRDVSVTACGCERARWDPVAVHPFEYYVRFFKRHGAGLRYLSLVFTFARIDSSYGAWPAPELSGIQRLLDSCPEVEHLVLGPWKPADPAEGDVERLHHARVTWVDVFTPNVVTFLPEGARGRPVGLNGGDLPSLKGIRFFDYALVNALSEDITRALSPSEQPKAGECWSWRYQGVDVQFQDGVVWSLDLEYVHGLADKAIERWGCDSAGNSGSDEENSDEEEAAPPPESGAGAEDQVPVDGNPGDEYTESDDEMWVEERCESELSYGSEDEESDESNDDFPFLPHREGCRLLCSPRCLHSSDV